MPEANNLVTLRHADPLLDGTLIRLPRWMVGVGAAGVLGCLVAGQARSAAGLAVGAGVALLSYWWLYRGIQAAFDSGRARAPGIVFLKLALRYPLTAGAILLLDRTGWLPARAVVAGMFAPLAGVLIECLVLLTQAFLGRWPRAEQIPRLRQE